MQRVIGKDTTGRKWKPASQKQDGGVRGSGCPIVCYHYSGAF